MNHTPGPWEWRNMGGICLVGNHSDRPIVLNVSGRPRAQLRVRDFERCLMVEFDPEHPDARLIQAAPDHALYAAALTAGVIRWEPFGIGASGEICVGGLRYSTTLDEFGVPEINEAVRPAIVKALKTGSVAIAG